VPSDSTLVIARGIIVAAKSAPAPLAGRVDTDRVLADRIAAALEEAAQNAIKAERERIRAAVLASRDGLKENSAGYAVLSAVLDHLA